MFPPEIAAALHQAVDDLTRYRGDRFEQFDCIRATMARLTRADAFYVAEFVGNDSVHYRHQYDEDTFDLPGSMPVMPGRTAHWVRTHRRTYTYAEDSGAALNAGTPFGQLDKVSRDAIVTPIFDDADEKKTVIGLVSIQTYTPGTYDATAAAALEYLAECLAEQIAYEDRSAARSRRLGLDGREDRPAEDVLGDILVALSGLHSKLDRAIANARMPGHDPVTVLRGLRRNVERLQSDLWARELHQQRLIAERLASLTPRQRQLATLLAEPSADADTTPSNAWLAAQMSISEVTVKSHMNVILRSFQAADRAEVRTAVRRLTKHRVHRSS
jgi:DNA-binding CsgD family transcriptional regulator